METIEKMARLCMRDPDEDEEEGTDEEDVEEDDELLVRAQRPGEMGQGSRGWGSPAGARPRLPSRPAHGCAPTAGGTE